MVTGSRNRSIDTIKGVLIFIVILGHILLGTLDDNPFRYFIYTFHMPAFFFISGYLLNPEKIAKANIKQFFLKYWQRMLKSWLLAWIVYSMFVFRNDIDLKIVVSQFYHPYYHLWFIPSLFCSITIIYIAFHLFMDRIVSYILLICIGIFLLNLNCSQYGINGYLSCNMLIYLLLGMISRNLLINTNNGGGNIALYIALVLIINLLGIDITIFRRYFQLPMCMFLCTFGIIPLINSNKVKSVIFEFWGRNSMEIYLWHVIPIIVLKTLFSNTEPLYYAVSFILIVIFSIISFFITKRKDNENNSIYTSERGQ